MVYLSTYNCLIFMGKDGVNDFSYHINEGKIAVSRWKPSPIWGEISPI